MKKPDAMIRLGWRPDIRKGEASTNDRIFYVQGKNDPTDAIGSLRKNIWGTRAIAKTDISGRKSQRKEIVKDRPKKKKVIMSLRLGQGKGSKGELSIEKVGPNIEQKA